MVSMPRWLKVVWHSQKGDSLQLFPFFVSAVLQVVLTIGRWEDGRVPEINKNLNNRQGQVKENQTLLISAAVWLL